MKRRRFTEEQIAYALRQAEGGTPIAELCRSLGISEQSFYRWKRRYEGMGVAELRRLRLLEQENRKLKQIAADLTLDKQILQDVLRKKALRPARKRDVIEYLQAGYSVGIRRAGEVVQLRRSTHHYRSTADPQTALRVRLRDLAGSRVQYGYRRLHVLLRREGRAVNVKRVYRLYDQEGLALRTRKPRRRRSAVPRVVLPEATRRNQIWSMDFVSDELGWGHRFRVLTLVDHFTRESPALEVGVGMGGPPESQGFWPGWARSTVCPM
jgi:putative transposase